MYAPRNSFFVQIFTQYAILRSCHSFRCFSEYEFTWWDSFGIEHVNGFSMSHFQLKMKSMLVDNVTERVPFKEAFFLTKLHGSYKANLTEECPHAMIQANFLVSAFLAEAGDLEDAVKHYSLALNLFNKAPAVHQQVSLLAWPFERAKNEVEERLRARISGGTPNKNVTIAVFLESDPTGFKSFNSGASEVLRRFAGKSLIIISSEPSMVPPDMPDEFDSVEFRNESSICRAYLSILNSRSGVILFLDLRSGISKLSLYLIRVYLEFALAATSITVIPPFYSFEHTRSVPSKLPGGYTGNSFAVKKLDKSEFPLELCTAPPSDATMWESLLRPNEQPSIRPFFPLRCDDSSYPWSLRLCRGDEPFKTDWRDSLLSPVLPRKPVVFV